MKSLSRALTVLTELGRHGHPQSLSDITSSVGLHKSTVHRMLATFVEYGLVRRDEANRYVIGLGALELARAVRGDRVPEGAVLPALSALHDATGQPASYAIPRAGQLTYAARVGEATPQERTARPTATVPAHGATTAGSGRSAVRAAGLVDRPPGSGQPCLPMHATALGKAYLAHRPYVEIDRFTARAPFPAATPRTITDPYQLLRTLAWVRSHGFATEDGEHLARVRRVGAPVLDHDGLAVAAVAVDVPPGLCHPAQLRRLAGAVAECAERIRDGLLGQPEAAPVRGAERAPAGPGRSN